MAEDSSRSSISAQNTVIKVGLALMLITIQTSLAEDGDPRLWRPTQLKLFVDELPVVPKLIGYGVAGGEPVSTSLKIGMFYKKWKFHRDIPPTPVFAYGTSRRTATIPGPTIEAIQGVDTYITWQNLLPPRHILPWDPTIPVPANNVPTVVHLHGAIHAPRSDGHPRAWFTPGFKEKGPAWENRTYHYPNQQHPGTLWYHDHAMGLTRVNLLAGLAGAYVIRQPHEEAHLHLPSGDEFDRVLFISDRSFFLNGTIYMDPKGSNPMIHPQWQAEYCGDVIIVNGKARPRMTVRRRKYRFRIINASNARFFRLQLSNNLHFIHVGADSAYLPKPAENRQFLLGPSEIVDVIIDFSKSTFDDVVLVNDSPCPLPEGKSVNESTKMVMRFTVIRESEHDPFQIPQNLLKYPSPDLSTVARTRYITLYKYTTGSEEPTRILINGLTFSDPATETPKVGTAEIWYLINLTEDNHPLHIHLGLLVAMDQTHLVGLEPFTKCMYTRQDAEACMVHRHARGKRVAVPAHERGWKNVFKLRPGFVTRLYVSFSYIHTDGSYRFDATEEPGYVYHCHILDHEDNEMMRPLKLIK